MLCLTLTLSLCLAPQDVTFDDLRLELHLGALEDLATGTTVGEHHRGRWTGKLAGSEVRIDLVAMSEAPDLPPELLDLIESARSEKAPFAFEETRPLPGSFGWVPYAQLGFAREFEGTRAVATTAVLVGVLEKGAYVLELHAAPAWDKAGRDACAEFLTKAVRFTGSPADPNWTDDEAEGRWASDAPDSVLERSKLMVVRTAHYLILTNQGKGTAKSFGEALEKCYEAIREVYPFEDVEGQRLLPVFYFVTADQYIEWCVKNLQWKEEAARRSKGVATGDVYATYHQATSDPVHIHEATHQIFRNRLNLPGGGSWFQEGVAEYMSDEANELGVFRNTLKNGKMLPFDKFMTQGSLLMDSTVSTTGENTAGNLYDQAAALIEFVRHGAFCEGKFLEFVHRMGRVPRGDLGRIEEVLQGVFGVGVEGFQGEFVKYWEKRKKPRSK